MVELENNRSKIKPNDITMVGNSASLFLIAFICQVFPGNSEKSSYLHEEEPPLPNLTKDVRVVKDILTNGKSVLRLHCEYDQ